MKALENTEAMAILGAVTIAVVSLFILGAEAKEIALGVGMGFVGYIARSK